MFKFLNLMASVALAICFLGCGPSSPPEPSDREIQSSTLLKQTFVVVNGDWFAAEKLGATKKVRLVQFHKPTSNVFSTPVSDTDRMNGVEDRFGLTFTCEQVRYWDGKWSLWVAGTGGTANNIANQIMGGMIGYWTITFERKNGEWSQRNMMPIHNLLQDATSLSDLLEKSGSSLQQSQ